MDYNEYLELKNGSKAKKAEQEVNVPRHRFEITDDDHLKQVKEAVEKYEEDNFNLTFDDYAKMDECFDDAISQLKFSDDECDGFEESELSRIVRVMRYLDWNYGGKTGEITEEECLECLKDLYKDAMHGAVKYKTKIMTVATGGWYVEANFEHHSVRVHFNLFDYYEYYEELMELKKLGSEGDYEG